MHVHGDNRADDQTQQKYRIYRSYEITAIMGAS